MKNDTVFKVSKCRGWYCCRYLYVLTSGRSVLLSCYGETKAKAIDNALIQYKQLVISNI